MIKTFYGLDQLVTAPSMMTFLAAMLIGLLFGFALERAGFGSSRRLAGIFYFRDMTVLRVMFTALITAMLGLSLLVALGWIDLASQVYLLPTVYGAQIVGGLIFGVGFVLSGWCPGTGAVGLASGKLDALVFLVGVVIGAIVYNETSDLTASLLGGGKTLVAFGLPHNAFALLLTLVAVAAFYFAEWIERRVGGGGTYLNSTFLRVLCVVFVAVAMIVFVLPEMPGGRSAALPEQQLLEAVEAATDHIEPEELADALMWGEKNLVVVDVRPSPEYAAFHIRGAVNVPLSELIDYLTPRKNQGRVVLYSNGMTHPAQARDALARMGFQNVFMLTDGLQGFVDRCLKPVSLRSEPLPEPVAARVRAWQKFFLVGKSLTTPGVAPAPSLPALPGLVDTSWLAAHLGQSDVKIVDCRAHADYTTSHIPGSVCLMLESFRGDVGGVPSMLLPGKLLAEHLSLMGIRPSDVVVLVPGEAVRDATLIGLGLERVGHARWGILDGGFAKWVAEKRPLDTSMPNITPNAYPPPATADHFTVDYETVGKRLHDNRTILLDVRPPEFFSGRQSTEARPGHIPEAINRPFTEDLAHDGTFKPVGDLEAAYQTLISTKNTPMIVYCRTGHQASQTYFVLRHLLGYTNVKWYDAGWTQWSARPELPVER